jgi:hypothetical protein
MAFTPSTKYMGVIFYKQPVSLIKPTVVSINKKSTNTSGTRQGVIKLGALPITTDIQTTYISNLSL